MAEKKTGRPDPEELVEYTAPIDYSGNTSDTMVGVNGEFIRIKNGETVRIKRKFLEVLHHAEQQKRQTLLTMNRAQKAGQRAMADL